MAETSLRVKASKGLFWSAFERFSVQGAQFIVGLVLARLLMPSDYGIIGMITIFIAVFQTFIDSGFSSALIQKKNRSETDYSTVFYFNIAVALVLYLLLFFLSPFIARFYDTPLLVSVTKVIGLNLIINSFVVVQRAKLTIELDFKTQARVSLVAVIIGGLVGIILAFKGYGVWSLVAQNLSRSFVNTILFWISTKWVPKKVFSKKSFRSLFSFGSKLLGAAVLDTVFKNIYLIIIGKAYTTRDLGYYTQGKQFRDVISINITGIMQRVTYPVLSTMQDEEERLKVNYRKFIKMSAFIVFPLMIALAALARPMINIVLTEKWLPAVPIIQVLCLAGMLYPIHAINLNILNVKGRSDLFLRLEIIKKIITIIAIIITFPYGILVMVWGQVVTSVIAFYINTYYSKDMVGYGFWDQIKDLTIYLIMSIVMGVCVLLFMSQVRNLWVEFIGGAVIGLIVYLFLACLFKVPELKEMHSLKDMFLKSTKKRMNYEENK